MATASITSYHNLYRLAQQAMAKNDFKQAIACCRELNLSYPQFQAGWRIACHLHLQLKNPKAALKAVDQVLSFEQALVSDRLRKIDILLQLDQRAAAVQLLFAVTVDDCELPEDMEYCGHLAAKLQQHEKALACFQAALVASPESLALHYNIGAEYRFLGDLAAAEIHLNIYLSHNIDDHEAVALRSSLRRQSSANNHIELLKSLLPEVKQQAKAMPYVHFALAKELADIEDYAQSFHYLKKGNDLRRAGIRYQLSDDIDKLLAIRKVFNADFFQQPHCGCDDDAPIFIVGLPRTGTTLLESMLSQHSQVYAAGELNLFAKSMLQQLDSMSAAKLPSGIDMIRASADINMQALGQQYLEALRARESTASRIVDKLPFNSLYIGLIKAALPNAKIIALRRQPEASCYAIYKQLFHSAYPFSYDLQELAQYMVAHHQLMQHWDDVLPGAICYVDYEQLVNAPEAELARVLDYCQLNFEVRCLAFHQRHAVTTASASQIRQGLYASSIDEWRKVRSGLKPALDILSQQGLI